MKYPVFLFVLLFFSIRAMAQNVGINTPNPQEQLHIRNDSTRMVIRLDNKKSGQEGYNYFTLPAAPSGAQVFEINPDWKDWSDLNHNKLVDSDNNRMTGPQLEIAPDWANGLKVVFGPSSAIPSNAEITDVTLHVEWRRIGDFAGIIGFGMTLYRNANNQPLLNFGIQQVSNSTDILYSIAYQNVFNPFTPDMFNLGDMAVVLQPQLSYSQGLSWLEIDKMWLEVEYRIPSPDDTNVYWSAGVKQGSFRVTNSGDLNSNAYLTIDESGVTQLKGLRISKNAGPGKVLMSNDDGRASWQTLPVTDTETLWFSKEDTVFYGNGPVQVHNKINEAALIFDKGDNRLNNGINFAETDNRVFNVIIDADNDQNNEQFNIYKDSTEVLNQQPAVRLNLGGNDSWINGGGKLGIGNSNPGEQLDVNGAVKIGGTNNPSPQAGTVRWNVATNDFEGFDGSQWRSLTKKNVPPWGPYEEGSIHENQKGTASDGSAADQFGFSVSISGNYAIVGAAMDDNGSTIDQGSAYIFVRSGLTWSQQAKLTASDGAAGDQFGYSVSLTGDYAIIGASEDDNGSNVNQGSAYIFMRSGTVWTQQAKLTASDGATGNFFGCSVSISGDYVIIGSYGDDIGSNTAQGSAYIFLRSGSSWTQQTKLTASDGAAEDFFGFSVAISGDYAIIGSYGDDMGSSMAQGSAYLFLRSGSSWTQQTKLTASDGAAGDFFGYSVAISGDYAIIGAYGKVIGTNNDQGAAYIFVRSGSSWTQQEKLTATDGDFFDRFGISVALAGEYAIVGAFRDEINGNSNQGSAYIFKRSGTSWIQQVKFTASDGAAEDFFGSVAISGDYAIVGAREDDIDSNMNQGSVYFFRKN